jgi:CheY-like chemotaxis protein
MRLGQVNSVALSAGDYVRIEVQDNGPGIPSENLEHIFEPFFSTRTGGTGLGLAMVRSILTEHEGAIEVASTVGTGTTFTIYFPRATTTPVKETSKPMAVTYGTGRILIMDDDADLCMVAKGMLEVLGYEADTATSAEAAIAAVRKYREMGRRYTAVILDLTMAGGPGGEDVLPRLREIDPEIVAIVSSGYATEDQVERYQKVGFRGMLAKPYRSGDLGRALKEVVGGGK